MMRSLLVGLLAPLAFVSCATSGEVVYVPTQATPQKAPVQFEDVLITYRRPLKRYQQTGMLETRAFPGNEGVRALRQKAAALGLDGVYNVHCAGAGTADQGNCTGIGFLWIKP